ncbi:hypothetical protein ACJ41O_008852 [Fusarium nematophilum]
MHPSTLIKALVLTKTRGFRHDSIPAFISALESLPFTVHATEDSQDLLSLSQYDVVVLGHTTGEFLTSSEADALRAFVENGTGGVVGVHAATSGMATSDTYTGILGEVFNGHPDPQWGQIVIENRDHYINRGGSLPGPHSVPSSAPPCPHAVESESKGHPWFDELYTFKSHPREKTNRTVLLSVKEFEYKEEQFTDYPLSWCQEVGRGRVFYTALGHFDEAYEDKWFMETLRRAITWAARRDGQRKRD